MKLNEWKLLVLSKVDSANVHSIYSSLAIIEICVLDTSIISREILMKKALDRINSLTHNCFVLNDIEEYRYEE